MLIRFKLLRQKIGPKTCNRISSRIAQFYFSFCFTAFCFYLLRDSKSRNQAVFTSKQVLKLRSPAADDKGLNSGSNHGGSEAIASFKLSAYEVKFQEHLLNDIEYIETHCRNELKPTVRAINFHNRNNPLKICLHSANQSTLVSYNLRVYGLWEHSRQKRLFSYMMKNTPNAVFVDGGAMLGVYSLSAARAGLKVLAFEPFEENRRLFMTSLAINNLTNHVTVFSTGLWSVHRCLLATEGDTIIDSSMMVKQHPCNLPQGDQSMVGATLDDLIPILQTQNRHQAVVKLDIEGSESRVLLAAQEFLSKIDVPLIQMEFGMLYKMHLHNYKNVPPLINFLKFMKEMGYEACEFQKRSENSLKSLSNRNISRWPWDIIWAKTSCF